MYSTTEASALPWRSVENGWTKIEVEEEEEEGPPAVRLRLGTGDNAPPRKRLKEEERRNGKVVFTAAQLHELHLQVIIFRHIEAGLPVPLRLLVPIWTPGSNLLFPNPLVLRSYNNITMLDPEPGRCRRTDGKKWRCGRNVVPHQKYCERHVHRGSQRSRKHVEVSESTLSKPTADTTPVTRSHDRKPPEGLSNLQHYVGASPGSIMTNQKSGSSNISAGNTNSVSTIATAIATHVTNTRSTVRDYMSTAQNVESCYRNPISAAASASTSTNIFAASELFRRGGLKDDYLFVKRDQKSSTWDINKNLSYGNKGDSLVLGTDDERVQNIMDRRIKNETKSSSWNIIDRSIKTENTVINIGMSLEVEVSPNSVLQGSSSSGMKRNVNEIEPGRCRRTDGKRWRCKRDVVTDQKYCSQHMHRGSYLKRHARSPLHPNLSCPSIACRRMASELSTQKSADCSDLGKNLSIAVPSPELDKEYEISRSSCSSDATISDTIFTD